MTAIAGPSIEYDLLSPLFAVSATAVVGVLVETVVPRGRRFVAQVGTAVIGLLSAFALTVWVWGRLGHVGHGGLAGRGKLVAEGAVSVDGPGVVTWGLLLVFSLLAIGLMAERELEGGLSAFTGRAGDAPGSAGEAHALSLRVEHTEIFPLAMLALTGMMLFATSSDLLTMFVALEVLSLPLYILCGLARRRRLISQEAALKYFLLGAFSSVFFLYGAALVYGYAGSVDLAAIDRAVTAGGSEKLLITAVALLLVGLLFKIGAVPFHAWTPDVYQGAPTPITAFMAAGTKCAALVALLRVLFVAFGGAAWDWQPVVWAVAAVTMIFGSLVAIAQTDVKRMLGYSSVANAGFMLIGVVGAFAGADRVTSLSGSLFYLAAYGLASIGAFAVVMLVRDASGESTHLSHWAGLGKTSPLIAGAFALFMLSFAGIPFTGGFIGKWTVFTAAWSGGFGALVVVGALASAIAAYFYLRMIVLMFFTEPADGPAIKVVGRVTTVVVVIAAAGTLALGVVPGPFLELVQHAGAFVR
jgi:NADH-quinone oxidoreductase subunit N